MESILGTLVHADDMWYMVINFILFDDGFVDIWGIFAKFVPIERGKECTQQFFEDYILTLETLHMFWDHLEGPLEATLSTWDPTLEDYTHLVANEAFSWSSLMELSHEASSWSSLMEQLLWGASTVIPHGAF